MGRMPLGRVTFVMTAALWITGCGAERHDSSEEAVSYASREPGANVVPTNDASFRLLGADGPMRLEVLRSFIIESGHRCGAVTRGVLEAGLDGTDEWTVKCRDTGNWQLWFKPEGGLPDVVHCAVSKCT